MKGDVTLRNGKRVFGLLVATYVLVFRQIKEGELRGEEILTALVKKANEPDFELPKLVAERLEHYKLLKERKVEWSVAQVALCAISIEGGVIKIVDPRLVRTG